MKAIKILSKEANDLRESFQKNYVEKYIKETGSLKGYKRQIYILLPRFDRRRKIYKEVNRETYIELDNYLRRIQSQRVFNSSDNYTNELMIVKYFESNFSPAMCRSRVWHNGVTCLRKTCLNDYLYNKHWAAQARALRNKVKEYSFTYYSNDYNFSRRSHEILNAADEKLVRIYEKIIDKICK